jgi:ribosomal protein S18 acetylase RimI-like enzyme
MAMANVPIEITTVSEANLLPARETLVQAFADDPVAAHLFPDASKRPSGMAHIFQMALRYGIRHGQVDVIQPADAVAIWMRPEHATPSWSRLVRAGYLTTLFAVGWSATRRMLRFEHFIEGCRLRTLAPPHWYLFSIGVRPGQQGQGLGAALLRHGLQRAQATSVPCYLDTANARNLPFYEKHGFRVVGAKRLPTDGPGVWSLIAGGNEGPRSGSDS